MLTCCKRKAVEAEDSGPRPLMECEYLNTAFSWFVLQDFDMALILKQKEEQVGDRLQKAKAKCQATPDTDATQLEEARTNATTSPRNEMLALL